VGPFFGFALPWPDGAQLVPPGTAGAVELCGRVLDGAGAGVPDALVELWQPDSDGLVPRPGGAFTGFGRCPTDADGGWSFLTLRPGAQFPGACPFFALTVFARGLLDRLFTRAYLPAAPEQLAADRLLAALAEDRRATLLCREDGARLRFDIRLQGPTETVFLSFPGHRV
jgi:protocatechuate 3,4-dioxygenase alpha subunit